MKLGKMEVKRVAADVVVVSQEIDDNEVGCYVSKASDSDVRGRYLHQLASAVADLPALSDVHYQMIRDCLVLGVGAGRVQQGQTAEVIGILDLYRKD